MSMFIFARHICTEFVSCNVINTLDKLICHFRIYSNYKKMLYMKHKYGISISSKVLRGKEFSIFKRIYEYICTNNKYTNIVLTLINIRHMCFYFYDKMVICTNRKLLESTEAEICTFYNEMFNKKIDIVFAVNTSNISEISIEIKNVVYRYNVYKDIANDILNDYNYSIWKTEKA